MIESTEFGRSLPRLVASATASRICWRIQIWLAPTGTWTSKVGMPVSWQMAPSPSTARSMFCAMIVSACDGARAFGLGAERRLHGGAHVGRQIGRGSDDELKDAVEEGRQACREVYMKRSVIGGVPRPNAIRSASVQVPAGAYYGVQTAARGRELPDQRPARARRPRHRDHPRQEGRRRGQPRARTARTRRRPTPSSRAADEILAGALRDQFVVDVYQAGAGTSHNMNANEVLANRAAEMLGEPRGTYARVHPNDHVNMGQSTNDVFPTATRLALLHRARAARREPRATLAGSARAQGATSSPTC